MILFLGGLVPCDLLARLLEWEHLTVLQKHTFTEVYEFKFNKLSDLTTCILSREIMEKGNCPVSPKINGFAFGKHLITS